jgi:probable O-glycosylation ligase (exosortase A-associated)
LKQALFRRQTIAVVIACSLAVVSAHIALNYPPRPALAIFCALLGGIVILVEPFVGVVAYNLLGFLRPQDVFWGFADMRLTLLVSIPTLFAGGVRVFARGDFEFLKKKQCLFVVILWAFIWLSTQLGEFAGPEPGWMAHYSKMFIIYFVTLAFVTSEKRLYLITWVIMLSVGYLAVWANHKYLFENVWIVQGPGPPGATLRDRNDFAMTMVMAVPFMWYIMRHVKWWPVRLFTLGLVPLTTHAIMVTFSRGGFLGLITVLGVIALRERNKTLLMAMVLAGIAFFVTFSGGYFRERVFSIVDYEEDGSATGRIESWETGLRMVENGPLFGMGLNRYVEAFPHYSDYHAREAHNSWIQMAAECGLIAVGSYGMLVVLSYLSLRRARRRAAHLDAANRDLVLTLSHMVEASLAGYLVCGFFLSMEDLEFFYTLVAMAQILDRTTETRQNASPAVLSPPGAGHPVLLNLGVTGGDPPAPAPEPD